MFRFTNNMRKIPKSGKSKTKLKKKAWEWFSKYIRLRDCLKTTGRPDIGACVTCGRTYEFKQLQAGHFIPGRHNSVLFHEKNCHAQCYHCNLGLKGNPIRYWRFMEQAYGDQTIKELEEMDRQITQTKAYELEALAEAYKDLYEDLYKQFNAKE